MQSVVDDTTEKEKKAWLYYSQDAQNMYISKVHLTIFSFIIKVL